MESASSMESELGHRGLALVTGASEGFGREIARLIAADGFDLVVVARNEERLEELAKELEAEHSVEVRIRCADLSDSEQQRVFAAEVRDLPQLAVVINNAAFSIVDPFHEIPIEQIQKIVSLNLAAVAVITHAALNNADFRRGGTLVNVGSIGGSWPLPFDAIYSATKAAIDRFSAAVAYEVEKNPEVDVHVQVAKLGGILTEWADRAMGPLARGEKPDKMIEMLSNKPAPAARTVWSQTKLRSKAVVSDHWFAGLQGSFFGVFQRLGSAMVYATTSKERARRSRQ